MKYSKCKQIINKYKQIDFWRQIKALKFIYVVPELPFVLTNNFPSFYRITPVYIIFNSFEIHEKT